MPVLLLVLQVTLPVGLIPSTVVVQVTDEPDEAGFGEQTTNVAEYLHPEVRVGVRVTPPPTVVAYCSCTPALPGTNRNGPVPTQVYFPPSVSEPESVDTFVYVIPYCAASGVLRKLPYSACCTWPHTV